MIDKNLLVVEDEFGSAEILQLILEVEGYRVVLAANGVEALQRTKDASFDLVLADFMMPIMNGAQLGRALRESPSLAHVPIVMMSAAEEVEVRRQFSDYDAFLQKPYRIDELLPLLAKTLSSKRSADDSPDKLFSLSAVVRDWFAASSMKRRLVS
jgi:two-component system phosphate regulon response regulator PhoB